jgi:hypothetical protein
MREAGRVLDSFQLTAQYWQQCLAEAAGSSKQASSSSSSSSIQNQLQKASLEAAAATVAVKQS